MFIKKNKSLHNDVKVYAMCKTVPNGNHRPLHIPLSYKPGAQCFQYKYKALKGVKNDLHLYCSFNKMKHLEGLHRREIRQNKLTANQRELQYK